MSTLKKKLAALVKSLGIQKGLRAFHRRRMLARHKEQQKYERQLEAIEDVTETLWRRARHARKEGKTARANYFQAKARRKERKAQRLKVKRDKAEAKAIVWKQRARAKTLLIEGIKTRMEDVEAELEKFKPVVHWDDNKTTGGDFNQRWQTSNLASVQACSNGRRRNAYSQGGVPDIWHPYGPGPASGRRDDCSSYVTSQALATDADDPNGFSFSGVGYTGTLVQAHGRWKQVSLAEMIAAGQGYIVYGSGTGHHTEAYCPSATDKMRTVGHGSAPVDFGTVHLFGPNETERYFIYAGD